MVNKVCAREGQGARHNGDRPGRGPRGRVEGRAVEGEEERAGGGGGGGSSFCGGQKMFYPMRLSIQCWQMQTFLLMKMLSQWSRIGVVSTVSCHVSSSSACIFLASVVMPH